MLALSEGQQEVSVNGLGKRRMVADDARRGRAHSDAGFWNHYMEFAFYSE